VSMSPKCVVLHTTESNPGTCEAVAAYLVRMGYESHEVFDPSNGDLIQLLPPSEPGKSLVNLPGGVETNRRGGVYQIEIVGRAVDVPNYDDAWYERLRVRLLVICNFTGTPYVFPLPFQPYPQSYGKNLVRLNYDDWQTVEGLVGHQHVPENDHGDPGALDITRLQKDDDMTIDDLVKALGSNARNNNGVIEIQLVDGNWYQWGFAIRYTHQEAQQAAKP
jgi:hypothetical protein